MTKEEREEAIYQLERCIHNAKVSGNKYSHFELAIEALKVEPCPDAISRQEAIDIVDSYSESQSNVEDITQDIISDIVGLPPVHSQPNKEDIHREREQAYMRGYEDGSRKYRTEQSEDAISRQAVVDFLENHAETYEDVRVKMGFKASASLINNRNNLPSVNPQPKTGHWITKPHIYGVAFCSECDELRINKTKFCPNCGAKMVEPQETEIWNGIHAQITAPKGTFERIFNDADDDSDI